MYRLVLGNYRYDIPANIDQLAQKMGKWFPEDQQAIKETLLEIKQIGNFIFGNSYEKSETISKKVFDIMGMFFAEYLDNRFKHPHASKVLGSLHPYAGVPMNELSALFMMCVITSYQGGAFYPRGG
ncbi:hypothetical protein [Thermoflavimicrobium daqui]|nr:hypothetical protein [Thermoflavimicrobium daqui]